MSKNQQAAIIFLAIAALIIFGAGAWLGFFYASGNPRVKQAEKLQPALNILKSKVVENITAFGKVENISGASLTINNQGDRATISVKQDALIYSSMALKDPKTGNLVSSAPKIISFSQIKIGDTVTVSFKIDANGSLAGEQVFIFASLFK